MPCILFRVRCPCWITAVFLAALVAPAGAAESRYWQLTFSYDPRGVYLTRAAPIAPQPKALRTPGLADAALKLEYDLEWQDAQGRSLLVTPMTVPFKGRVILGDGPQPEPHEEHVMPDGAFVVRVPGPDDAVLPQRVRLLRRGVAARAAAPDPAPPAFHAAEQMFALPGMARAAGLPAPGPISATKVRNTGGDSNRFVIVIMGDGFTAANLAAGAFSSKVTSFLNVFFGRSPWNTYQNAVNVYRVDIESTQAGADYEDAAPAAGGTLKDTYLNSAFWVGGTERCLFLTGNGAQRAIDAADDLVGAGVWDEVLVFVNSTKYGGCGGSVGVSSLNSSADEVQIHEFGHSFGNLADEYDYGSSSTTCNFSSARNVDCSNNFPHVKWDVWVTPGAPFPTPNTAQYDNTVGAFEGAAYQLSGMFRPKRNCLMRSLGVSFCPVCKEEHILKLFTHFRIVDSASPPFGPADVPETGSRTFTATPVNVGGFSYRWLLGGVVLTNSPTPSLAIHHSQVVAPNIELRLEVTHNSADVRAQTIVQSNYSWFLRTVPTPSLRLSDVAVTEGNSGSVLARFAVYLSFPHSEIVTVNYSTTSGTAAAGSDFTTTAGTLTFPPGLTTNFINVPVLGDTRPEPHEVFFVNLALATGATLADRQASGLIRDNDNAPLITLTNPPPLALFLAPASIPLGADALDLDGTVTKVEFYQGASKLGQATNDPFSLLWSNVPAGTYVLTAIATDNSNQRGTSAPVSLRVLDAGAQQFSYVAFTDNWRFDQTTNDYGTVWKNPAYDDSAWAGPLAGVFFNETATLPAPKNTPLVLTNGGRLRSYYFRTHFQAPVPLGPAFQLIASNLIDDGAVFYLNGVEAARLRMPAGSISRTTLATGQPPGGDATAFEVLQLPAGLVQAGDNVLAVEVHQQTDTSTNVVFGLSLQAHEGYAPVILDPSLPASAVGLQSRPLTLSINATGAPPPVYQWFRNGSAVPNATNATFAIASMSSGAAGDYFVRITNAAGATDSRVAVIGYTPDTAGPGLVYALGSNTPTRILVSFSEPLNSSAATTLANYRLTSLDQASNLTITSATLQSSTNVLLATAARAAGMDYVLSVSHVRDLLNNTIASNSQILVASEIVALFADNQEWRFFQWNSDPGAGWMLHPFDDTAEHWSAGPALLDGKSPPGRATLGPNAVPVRTVLGLTNAASGSSQVLAYYFRSPFVATGQLANARLQLRTLVDDGAVFYLNGVEVLRLRMPPAPLAVNYTNLATLTQSDSQNVFEGPFDLPATALVSGTNLFAAEVHQSAETSPDISFAAQLSIEIPRFSEPPFELSFARGGGMIEFRWTKAGAVLQEAPAVTGPWTTIPSAPASPFSVAPTNTARFYRLLAP